ncbi:sucrose phosphatase [Stanieria cyanosphaera PCC 7437]|uniref:sucrose-phosphate phosphatase n=1 Tax=Stanieria cyanosphaera (strain ATCC 29371 / PCC 7437) TaxID=111780 RepID=K9XXE8_STAC7|nr:sucrose-phosphate phosphatase [Stanieria cyanosphaera]AFZ36342.1 sucrose phosphatase [Stanieria cyanosphaera PCC 7437]
MNPFLFVTDLDHTLVGDDRALELLNQQLEQHRQQYGTKIVYATGRSLYLYKQLAQEKPLLTPDALITAVGTEIYFNPSQAEVDREWAKILSQGWHREQIAAIANQYSQLKPQPESEQNPFKISYYLSESEAEALLSTLETELLSQGFKIKLVYSGSQDLDILPLKGDKGLAVQFLRSKWEVTAEATVTCGDSGNDIALFKGDEKGIIVGNAKSELRQWYQTNQNDSLYLAEAVCAGGILEGLKYFGFL